MKATEIVDADQYISLFPEHIQKLLQELRTIIRETVPDAEEVISYQMPAYKYHGMLVYFAGYPKHIGFYPTPGGISAFKEELSVYKNAKGSVQFPLNQALPAELIKKIVTFRMKENLEKEASKKPLKKKKA